MASTRKIRILCQEILVFYDIKKSSFFDLHFSPLALPLFNNLLISNPMSGNPTFHPLSLRQRFCFYFLGGHMDPVDAVKEKVDGQVVTNLVEKINQDSQQSVGVVVNNLIAERKAWQDQDLTRSNERLYGILQSCYILFQSMNSIKSEAMAIKKAFLKFCEQQGCDFNENAHLMTKVVQCVFGSGDRRRVSSYAIALRAAVEAKKPSMEIPQFFRDAGGVEEVRRKRSPNHKTTKDKAEIGRVAMNGRILASFHSDTLAGKFQASEYNGAVILLSTRETDGSFAVRRLVQSGSAITAVLSGLASSVTKEQEEKAPEVKAANDDQSRDQAIQQAVSA